MLPPRTNPGSGLVPSQGEEGRNRGCCSLGLLALAALGRHPISATRALGVQGQGSQRARRRQATWRDHPSDGAPGGTRITSRLVYLMAALAVAFAY